MPLLQLPDTHETEEETVEPDLEGKHCLYQTQHCVWTLILLKHAYSIALLISLSKDMILSIQASISKRTQVSVTSSQIAKPCYSS